VELRLTGFNLRGSNLKRKYRSLASVPRPDFDDDILEFKPKPHVTMG
jgi:hypothetical protein